MVLVGDFHLSSQGGVGYAPRICHTKDIKNKPTAALFSVKRLKAGMLIRIRIRLRINPPKSHNP